jgi:hypothetical protein
MPLSRRAIKLYIGNVFYQRALTMFKKGAVLEVGFDAEKGVVSGEVQGSQEDPYQVSFKLDADGKIMHSKCSCPMRRDCKHVATLALAYVREEGGGDEEEGGNVQKTVQEKIPLGVPNLLIRLTRDTPKRILLRATWRRGWGPAARGANRYPTSGISGTRMHTRPSATSTSSGKRPSERISAWSAKKFSAAGERLRRVREGFAALPREGP